MLQVMNPDSEWLQPLSECIVVPLNSNIPGSRGSYLSLTNVPVVWNLDVYMINSHPFESSVRGTHCELLKYSPTNHLWTIYPISCHRHHHDKCVHVLAVYHSKLVMIDEDDGGIKELNFDNTNITFKKLYDIEHLLTQPGKVVAASSEGKYLLVVCRRGETTLASIAIFDGNEWFFRSGPYLHHGKSGMIQVIVHNSTVFFAEREHSSVPVIHRTSLQVLLHGATSAWQLLESALPRPFYGTSNLVFLSNCLHIASYHRDFEAYMDRSVIMLWCYSEIGCIEVGRGSISNRWWLPDNVFLTPSQSCDGGVVIMTGLEVTAVKLMPQGT